MENFLYPIPLLIKKMGDHQKHWVEACFFFFWIIDDCFYRPPEDTVRVYSIMFTHHSLIFVGGGSGDIGDYIMNSMMRRKLVFMCLDNQILSKRCA